MLRLIARGATNREAAKQLFISEATVKTHLLHVYAKLGVNDRAAAVAAAYDRRPARAGPRPNARLSAAPCALTRMFVNAR